MVKLCGNTVSKPLSVIFHDCLSTRRFPLAWKMSNIVPVYKKGYQQYLENYCPVSFLAVCGKIFEKLIFKETFKHFIENDLISSKQSGSKPGDSCMNLLQSITHKIY